MKQHGNTFFFEHSHLYSDWSLGATAAVSNDTLLAHRVLNLEVEFLIQRQIKITKTEHMSNLAKCLTSSFTCANIACMMTFVLHDLLGAIHDPPFRGANNYDRIQQRPKNRHKERLTDMENSRILPMHFGFLKWPRADPIWFLCSWDLVLLNN